MKFRTDFCITIYLRDSCRKPKYCSHYILPAVTGHRKDWQSHLICSHKRQGSTDWRRAHHVKTLYYLRRYRQPWQCVKMSHNPPPPLNFGIIQFDLCKYSSVPSCFALHAATFPPGTMQLKNAFSRLVLLSSSAGPWQRSAMSSFSSSVGSVPRRGAVVVQAVALDVVNSYINIIS